MILGRSDSPTAHFYESPKVGILVQLDLQPFLSFGEAPNIFRIKVPEISCSGQKDVADSAQKTTFLSPPYKEEIQDPRIGFSQLEDIAKDTVDQFFKVLQGPNDGWICQAQRADI